MKDIKKLAVLALSILTVLSFAGCGSDDKSSSNNSSSTTESSADANSSGNSDDKNTNDSKKNSKINNNSDSKDKDAESEPTRTPLENGTYSSNEFSIEPGNDWKLYDDASEENDDIVFTIGSESYSSIRISKLPNDTKTTIDEYKESAIEQYNTMVDYRIDDTKDVEIDGRKAVKFYITVKSDPSLTMKMIQNHIIDGNDLYICTFTTSKKEYKKLKSEAENILDTFKIQ